VSGNPEVRLKPGDLIAGRYRLQEQIGEGAAASVFRATDEVLGRDVAVKVLRGALAASPAATARFRAEGRAAAIIAHPNVAAVFDVAPEGEAPAIIMEFVDGEDLASMLRRVGPLVPRRAAAIAAQVARGLAAAHQRGIIHRDVTSRNILIGREGRAQIADFGIAHAILEDGLPAGTTGAAAPLGTTHYVAPEVAAGAPATASSDLYGLGVVLFELLTGRRPAERGPNDQGPSPRVFRPDIPVELETITSQLLATNPKQRTQSATMVADALEAYVVKVGRTSIPPRAVGPAAGAPRALAGTRVARVAGEAGPGEPESSLDPSSEAAFDGDGEAMPLRTTLLTIAGVAATVVILLAVVVFGLRLGQVISAWSESTPRGSVLQQNPRAGLQVANGSRTDLVISLGPEPSPGASPSPSAVADTTVPALRCTSVGEAVLILEAAGLILDPASAALDPTEIIDVISPSAGVLVPSGSAVTVVISSPFGTPLAGCP